jgi:hypothetical protein
MGRDYLAHSIGDASTPSWPPPATISAASSNEALAAPNPDRFGLAAQFRANEVLTAELSPSFF